MGGGFEVDLVGGITRACCLTAEGERKTLGQASGSGHMTFGDMKDRRKYSGERMMSSVLDILGYKCL